MGSRYLGPLVLGVVAAAGWYNWRAWRRQTTADRGTEGSAGRAEQSWPGRPTVSALVAAWNEAPLIARHMRSFQELSYPSRQLVLCAGGDDGTYEIAKGLAGERVIVLEQRRGEGKQRALQRCLEASVGDIILLSDADCLFSDAAFYRLIGPVARGEIAVATGYREPLDEQRHLDFVRFQWLTEQASQALHEEVNGLWGGNCAIQRAMIERSGALTISAPTGTDYVQGRALISAGCPIRWIPESQVETRYPTDLRSYLRISRRWTKNILIYGPRFGDWRSTAQVLIAVGLASATLLPVLAVPIAGRIALALPVTSLTVATMNRMRRIALGARATQSPASWRLFAAAPVFALLDQAATLAAAVDVLSPQGRARW